MRSTRVTLLSLTLVFTACGGGSNEERTSATGGEGEGLTYELYPSEIELTQGGRGTIKVIAHRPRGSNEPIALDVFDLPEGVSATPTVIEADATSALIQLRADALAAPAEASSVVIQCDSAGSRVESAVRVTVSRSRPHDDTGNLFVSIVAPSLSQPEVTIDGPRHFHVVLTETTFLEELPVGAYITNADPLRISSGIVTTVYEGLVERTFTKVRADATSAVNVIYRLVSGTGHLWVSDRSAGAVVGFSAAQISASSTAPADVGIGLPGALPSGILVDQDFNLWVTEPGLGDVARFSPEMLEVSGSPIPDGLIDGLGAPVDLAFDPDGNLWILTRHATVELVELTPDLLPGPGETVTTVAQTIPLTTVESTALAFDSAGNLFVTDNMGGAVLGFNAATLAAGSGTPDRVITSAALHQPQGLAVDFTDNLWVADFEVTGGSVVRFNRDTVTGSGPLVLSAGLVITSPDILSPSDIAFDDNGNLWVANFSARTVVEFPGSQAVASGLLTTPAIVVVTMSSTGSVAQSFVSLAFDAPPTGR